MFIHPVQVIKQAGAKSTYETVWISPIIDSEEYSFFEESLSARSYNCMLKHKTSYTEVNVWDRKCSVDYSIGDYIIYDGEIYQKITTDTTSNPPKVNDAWEIAKRFNNEFLNNLWNMHLKSVLALKIYIASLPQATYQVGAVGATALQDTNDGLRGASKYELNMLIDSLGQRLYNKVQYMINYLRVNHENIPCLDWQNEICGSSTPVRNKLKTSSKIHLL